MRCSLLGPKSGVVAVILLSLPLALSTRANGTPPSGVTFAFNANGLSQLSYNGQSFLLSSGLDGSACFRTPAGVEQQTGYLSPDSGANPASVKKVGPNSVTHVYDTPKHFAVQTAWTVVDARTLRVDTTVTNNEPADALVQFNYNVFELSLPGVSLQYMNNVPLDTSPHRLTPGPVGFLGNTWGSVAFWQGDYSIPGGLSTTFGAPNVTAFKIGLSSFYVGGQTADVLAKNGAGVPLAYEDAPIAPGQSKKYSSFLRFGSPNDTSRSLAPEAFQLYAQAHPDVAAARVNRAPIARWFIANGPTSSSALNPRAYFSDPNLDVTNQKAFDAMALGAAQRAVASLNKMSPRPQGVVIWDLEGEEFLQPFTYVGDPTSLPLMAPEMDAVADQLFATFTQAGYEVGMTLRPQTFGIGPTLPAQATFDPFDLDYNSVFILTSAAYPFRGHVCSAPNTWAQASARMPNFQNCLHTDAEIVAQLEKKIAYARARWGAKLFYVDSTVYSGGGPLDFSIWGKIQSDYPDSLFLPEEQSTGGYNAASAYLSLLQGWEETPAGVLALNPQAYSFISLGSAHASVPRAFNNLVTAVQKGDILGCDVNDPQSQADVQQIYQAAGHFTGSEPIVSSFTASAADTVPGQPVTLSWGVSNATTVTIDQGIGTVIDSSTNVSPNATTTYTLTATNDVASAIAKVTVTVDAAPTLTGFTTPSNPPKPGAVQPVTINGLDLTGATSVSFNGTLQPVFQVVSATQILTSVPAGATTGPITVTTPGGSATTAESLTVP